MVLNSDGIVRKLDSDWSEGYSGFKGFENPLLSELTALKIRADSGSFCELTAQIIYETHAIRWWNFLKRDVHAPILLCH